jgi:hypothetical protein
MGLNDFCKSANDGNDENGYGTWEKPQKRINGVNGFPKKES